MEELKRLEEIYEPDERQKNLCNLNKETGEIRKMVLEDYHHMAEGIMLHSGVPEVVRDQFETARNLIVYSWFYYPFNVTAQLQAITCVELALKIKANCGFVSKGRPLGLKELLIKAVSEGWITDKGFAQVREIKIQDTSKIKFRKLNGEVVSSYCETVIEGLPQIRNYLMHGERLLHSQGADWVDKCAEIINQLFEVVE